MHILDDNIFLFDVVNGRFKSKGTFLYESIVCEQSFMESGATQIVFARTPDVVEAVTVGTFVRFQEYPWLPQLVVYIHTVQTKGNKVWAMGYEAKELFKKIPVPINADFSEANIQTVLTDLLDNVPFSWFGYGVISDVGTANLANLKYTNLYEFIVGICKLKGCGWFVDMDMYDEVGKGVLYFFEQDDHTNTERFSTNLGNMPEYNTTTSDSAYYNVVTAVGIDGNTIITEEASNQQTGEERYEYILDLREELPRESGVSLADYRDTLRTRAQMSLSQRKKRQEIKLNDFIVADGHIEYQVGWLVTIDIPELNLSATRVIDSVTFTVDGGRAKVKYSFAKP